jgi:hypothetical protein
MTATTDQRGEFAIHGVTPGEYGALAWEDFERGVAK